MTQELIVHLARFPDLRLFSIPASFGQSSQADPHELGRKLGPAYVVQESIRSEDSLVHVRAMLTAADGRFPSIPLVHKACTTHAQCIH
jgi:TolB-like protein